MDAPVTLRTAIGNYAHTRPLKDRTVSSPRLELEFADVAPVYRAFRPMVNDLAYDVSEMALVTLLLARAVDRPIVGIPVVMMQQSAYGMLVVPKDSSLKQVQDLRGKTIGVRSYTQTTGTWLRGMLHDQFGLDLDSLSWVTFEPAHVDGFQDPANVRRAAEGATLADLLREGDIDAAAGLDPAQHPDLRTLIPNAAEAEADWIRQTGIRPINHTLVVRRDIAEANPWIPRELYQLIGTAKQASGGEAPPDGLEPNRGALTLLGRYAFEQRITPRTLTAEDLF
jgi:4,5-dihydroxyphthalate decarboxylase